MDTPVAVVEAAILEAAAATVEEEVVTACPTLELDYTVKTGVSILLS